MLREYTDDELFTLNRATLIIMKVYEESRRAQTEGALQLEQLVTDDDPRVPSPEFVQRWIFHALEGGLVTRPKRSRWSKFLAYMRGDDW